MNITIKPDYVGVEAHIRNEDTPTPAVEVQAFPAPEGAAHRPFVTLRVRTGKWSDNTISEVTFFLSPSVASRLGGELTLRSAEACDRPPS